MATADDSRRKEKGLIIRSDNFHSFMTFEKVSLAQLKKWKFGALVVPHKHALVCDVTYMYNHPCVSFYIYIFQIDITYSFKFIHVIQFTTKYTA